MSPLSSIFLLIKKNHKKTLKLNYDLNCQYEMKITDFGKISLNFSSLNLFSWTWIIFSLFKSLNVFTSNWSIKLLEIPEEEKVKINVGLPN